MNSAWWFNLLLVLFTFVLAGVGIVQSFLLYYTYRVSKLAAEASRESAIASRESAAAANRALHLGRPILVIKQIVQSNEQWREDGNVTAVITAQNVGQRAAIVTQAFVGFVLLDYRLLGRPFLQPPIYELGESIKFDQPVIPPNGENAFGPFWGAGYVTNMCKPDSTFFDGFEEKEIARIKKHRDILNVYGIIRYRDASALESYETAFFWHFGFENRPPAGEYYVGPAAFQRST